MSQCWDKTPAKRPTFVQLVGDMDRLSQVELADLEVGDSEDTVDGQTQHSYAEPPDADANADDNSQAVT